MEYLSKEFKAEPSFWQFLLLGTVTGGVYFTYWMARNFEIISNTCSSVETTFPGLIKKATCLLWAAAALTFFATPMLGELMYEDLLEGQVINSTIYAVFYAILSFAGVLIFYISVFCMRKMLTHIYATHNRQVEIKTLWTVLFNVIYLYYTIKNADLPQNRYS